MAAFLTVATAGQTLWVGFSHWTVADQTLGVLNELLDCADAGEASAYRAYLHSLAGSGYRTFPDRRIDCFNTAHSCDYPGGRHSYPRKWAWATDGASGIFHSSMIELGLLGLMVLVLVVCITLLRHYAATSQSLQEL